jgi:hypothetical protein
MELQQRPPFVVWRAAPGVPPGFMPPGMEGRWDDRPPEQGVRFLGLTLPHERRGPAHDGAVAVRTSRIEHRDGDGASAEVWEVHPAAGNYDPDPAARLPLW